MCHQTGRHEMRMIMTKIILASGSPRRKELLEQIKLPYEVIVSDVDETTQPEKPEQIVRELSKRKAIDVFESSYDSPDSDDTLIVIGADTVVAHNGKILGKPLDYDDAFSMIKSYSGQSHHVYTGVTLAGIKNGKKFVDSFVEDTKVYVTALTDEEIHQYLRTGESMDKAGAYGIQGAFAAYISRIEGDYFNVVGLPLCALQTNLKKYIN